MEWPSLLLGTVVLRPYVFVFLAVYLTIAILNMGLVRSIVFTALAYTIAFLSEYSSTRIGFPYGFYEYIETSRGQELWISNVPSWIHYPILSLLTWPIRWHFFCGPP